MPQKLTFAGFDITLTPGGRIRLPSLAKALRDPKFAKRVRCVLAREFDGMIDGQREVKVEVDPTSIAVELERGNKRAHGTGAYLDRDGFSISVYDYCSSWDLIDRNEEIRRLEAIVDVMDRWTIDYQVTNGHHTRSVRDLAVNELKSQMLNADALAFDECIAKARRESDPMAAYMIIGHPFGTFGTWVPVATTSEVQP